MRNTNTIKVNKKSIPFIKLSIIVYSEENQGLQKIILPQAGFIGGTKTYLKTLSKRW